MSFPVPASTTTSRRAPVLPALALLVLADLRRMLRNPMFAMGTVAFPIMFFALFGLPLVSETTKAGTNLGQLILVNFGAYSLLSLAMFSFGSAIALERSGGWLKLLRASPMPTWLYFLSRILGALCFSTLSLALLYAFGHFAGGVSFSIPLTFTLLAKFLLAMIPLIAMGLSIGFLVSPTAAQVIANIVSVIMSFASGLFMPLDQLPKFIQSVAPLFPAYHLGQIVDGTVANNTAKESAHWLALAVFTLIFGALAVWGMKRDESREA